VRNFNIQLAHSEWLGDLVFCPHFQPNDDVGLLLAPGQENRGMYEIMKLDI